jgi:alkylation response protein AidB-like acyl-CoA dehydrogenase
MRFGLTEQQQAWREEVREFIRTDADPALFDHWSTSYESSGRPEGKAFRAALGRRGWLTPWLSPQLGGLGMGYVDQWILLDEICKAGLPKIGIAAAMIAPTIARVASDEMKAVWLPRIAAGEAEFALGYSEPDAGTDLANLRMTAHLDGDHFVLNGSKIWNSGAHVASHEWLTVRTDPDAPKHEGISILLVPMELPGITVRPIKTWGEHRTNEVFFDDLRVPLDSLVGDLNRGWEYITHALGSERLLLGETGDVVRVFDLLVAHLSTTVRKGELLSSDPVVRDDVARLEVELHVARLLSLRAAMCLDAGAEITYEPSALKIWITELRKRLADAGTGFLGRPGLLRPEEPTAPIRGLVEFGVRDAIRLGFTGGANEVQRDMVATRGLGLPRRKQPLTDRELTAILPSAIHKLGLSDIQDELVDVARKFRRTALSAETVRDMHSESYGHSSDTLWKSLASLGWIGLAIPEEFGGAGASLADLAVVTEELGRGLGPHSLLSQNAICSLLAELVPDSPAAGEILQMVCAGDLLVALGLTEADGSEDVTAFDTVARSENSAWVLNGDKHFVSDAHRAGRLLIAARLAGPFRSGPPELGLFVIDPAAEGLGIETVAMAGAGRQAIVRARDVRLDEAALLCSGTQAEQALQACLDRWFALTLADLIGLGHEVLEMTVRHLKRRVAFGVPLGTFQSVQHRCADMLIALDCSRELAYEAIDTLSGGSEARLELSRAGAFVLEAVKGITYAAHQLHGGIGYTLEHNLHLYTDRARAAELMFGPPRDHRAMVADLIGLRG